MKLTPFEILDLTGDDPLAQRAMAYFEALMAKRALEARGEQPFIVRTKIASRPRG
jgi:hypothetical protein